jgi:putative transcriptional regulator
MDFFTEDVSHLANQLLIAMPGMLDDQFAGTVLVCEHNDQGAMGLMVNRPTNIDLKDLFERIELKLEIAPLSRSNRLFGWSGANREFSFFILKQMIYVIAHP